jgi:hypothetical protein
MVIKLSSKLNGSRDSRCVLQDFAEAAVALLDDCGLATLTPRAGPLHA